MMSAAQEHGDLPVLNLEALIIAHSQEIFACIAAGHNPAIQKELLKKHMAALLAGIQRFPGYSKVKAIEVSATHLILEDGTFTKKADILLPVGGKMLKKSELEKIIS